MTPFDSCSKPQTPGIGRTSVTALAICCSVPTIREYTAWCRLRRQMPSRIAGNSMSEDVLLKYRLRDRQIHVATDAWFFPEGRASHFEQARYGEFRVDQDGASLLTDLL